MGRWTLAASDRDKAGLSAAGPTAAASPLMTLPEPANTRELIRWKHTTRPRFLRQKLATSPPSSSAVPAGISGGSGDGPIGRDSFLGFGSRHSGSTRFLAAYRDHARHLPTEGHATTVRGCNSPFSAGGGSGQRNDPKRSAGDGADGRDCGSFFGPGGWVHAWGRREPEHCGVSGNGFRHSRGSRAGRTPARVPVHFGIPVTCPSRWLHPWSCTACPGWLSALSAGWPSGADWWRSRLVLAYWRSYGGGRRGILLRDLAPAGAARQQDREPIAATWGVRLLAQVLAVVPAAAGVAFLVSHAPDPRRPSSTLSVLNDNYRYGGPDSRRAWTPSCEV